jgi:hypothetical protein
VLQSQVDKAEQDKQSAVIRAKGEVLGRLLMLHALLSSKAWMFQMVLIRTMMLCRHKVPS